MWCGSCEEQKMALIFQQLFSDCFDDGEKMTSYFLARGGLWGPLVIFELDAPLPPLVVI
jgi:hypothetical protein